MSDKWYTPSWGTYIQKLTVIDFTGEAIIQCDAPFVENTFVDDCK